MNDDQLTQILTLIAEKDIQEMDTLAAIRRQVTSQRTVQVRRRKYVIALALILLLLLSAVVAYALYQSVGDPGLASVEDAGLVTELGLTQTVNGLTMTLTKGYADANRIALWVTLENAPDSHIDLSTYWLNPTLQHGGTDNFFGTGGQSGSPDSNQPPNTYSLLLTFDHREPIPANGLYDLRLLSYIEPQPPFVTPSADGDPHAGSLAQFTIDFQLPGIKALELQPQTSVSANNVSMTLKSLRITPSQTTLTICFTMPSAQDWQPRANLTIDDQVGLLTGGGAPEGTQGQKQTFVLTDPQRCLGFNFVVPYNEDSKKLVFDVNVLQTSVPEVPSADLIARATAALAQQNIVVRFNQVDHGFGWDVISAPTTLSQPDLYQTINDSLKDQYPGPWHFEIALP